MRERGLSVDHVTVWRWVQRYAPQIERRLRPHLKPTNKSWRVDETYIRVKGKWTYLYRAVDSTGASIDFLLSAKRDAAAAKRFFQKALSSPNHPSPRVINVDKNPSYPPVIEELKSEGPLRRRCQLRPVQYLNNIVEQDHRAIKRRVRESQGFRSFWGAWHDPTIRSDARDSKGAGETNRGRSGRAPPRFHRRAVPDCEVMRCRTEPFCVCSFKVATLPFGSISSLQGSKRMGLPL